MTKSNLFRLQLGKSLVFGFNKGHTRSTDSRIFTFLKGVESIHSRDVVQDEEQLEEILEHTTVIHSLDVEAIIDLYASKCIDRGLNYQPEHALLFVEKFRKLCDHQIFVCEDNQISLASAQTLLKILQYNHHFYQLRLARNNLGDEGLAILAELLRQNNRIIHLDVSSNNITSHGARSFFEELIEIKSLVSLDISSKEGLNRNKVSVGGCEPLETILRCPDHPLQFLNLRGTAIKQTGLECILHGLAYNQTLQYLNVSYNDLNQEACSYLSIHLIKCQLTELDLSYNPLGNAGMDYFATLFEKDTFQLKRLNLAGCQIKSLGILKLFTCLVKNRSLEKLILDENNLGGNGFNQIENVLISRVPLNYLSLANCNISPGGAEYIGNGVERNKVLKTLILTENRICDYGGECIFKGMYFEKLDMKRCSLSDKSVASLSQMIKQSVDLNTLILADNDFHDSSGIILTEAIRGNSSLTTVDITENPLGYKFVEEINKVVQENKMKKEQNKVPGYLREVQKLKDFARQRNKISIEEQDLKERRIGSQQNLQRATEQKEQTKSEQIEKTLELEQQLIQIQATIRQMDLDRNKFENDAANAMIRWDDDYNNCLRDIQITNQTIIRLERDIRSLKDHKQVRKRDVDQILDQLRRKDKDEGKTLQSTQIECNLLAEKVRQLREGSASKRKK